MKNDIQQDLGAHIGADERDNFQVMRHNLKKRKVPAPSKEKQAVLR